MGGFQRLRRFYQDAIGGSFTRSHHDSGGRCQSQGARTGDHQDGDTNGQGKLHTIAQHQPDRRRHKCDSNNSRNEYPSNLISQLCDGCLGAGSFVYQPDNLRQSGVIPHLSGLHFEIASLIDGRTNYRIANVLLHGDALAGQGGFIHGGKALQHHAVHRDRFTGLDNQRFPLLYLFHGDLLFYAVPLHSGRLGRKVHQLGDGIRGLALGAGLQSFAQRDKGQDHPSGFKVQIHHKAVYRFHIAVTETNADLENGIDAVDNSRAGADGDQRIHIGRTVEQGLKAHAVVFRIDEHHGNEQQELGERKGDGVLHSQQTAG